MDYLDIIMGKYPKMQAGKYYEAPPGISLSTDEAGIPFDYEELSPMEKSYKHIIGNLIDKEGAELVIKTHEQIAYNVGAYVEAMDGRLFKITSVIRDNKAASGEAVRLFSTPLSAEFTLALTEVDNPFNSEYQE